MSQTPETKDIKPYMTRARACEIIIHFLKHHHAESLPEFEDALKLAWHALLGPERAGSPSIAHEGTQENNKAGIRPIA